MAVPLPSLLNVGENGSLRQKEHRFWKRQPYPAASISIPTGPSPSPALEPQKGEVLAGNPELGVR